MNTKHSKSPRKLLPALALMLVALFFLGLVLPAMGTRAISSTKETQQEPQLLTARAQGSTGEDVPLVGAEGWVQASVKISTAPDDAVVDSVRVKYHVVNSEPSDLEVRLLALEADLSHTLWNKESAEGSVLTQSTDEILSFQGAPVNGTWSLAVQGGDPEGYIDDFSIIVYYKTEMPVLRLEGEGAPGTPGFLRLPEDAAPASLPPDNDEKPSKEGVPVLPQDVPPGATIIEMQDFEGDFHPPGGYPPGWEVADQSADGYQRWWDDAQCDACGGDWAAWPADGGADGIYPCAGNNYPNNMGAWMVYGPFDLSNATDAGTEFVMWHDIEVDYDWVFFGFSGDGINFTGWFFDGYNSCTVWNTYYGSMLGDPSVWVAWVFYSDGSLTYEGPWVDDVVVWKVDDRATVKVAPPEKLVHVGSSFIFDIAIENASNLGAFEFELTYDPTCVQATDATLGPFLGSTGRGVGEVGPSFGTGSVTYGGYSWGSNAGPDGDGVLATVAFQAGSSACDSTLHLRNVSLTDTGGNDQSFDLEDGIVHITHDCPTPYDCPEDLNNDGVINIVDIQLVASKWGQHCPTR